jgi:hypothetical protein
MDINIVVTTSNLSCIYIMLQIIVEHTHLVISQYAHDAANNGKAHTSTYTTIMSLYEHTFSVKKKKLQGVSLKEDV